MLEELKIEVLACGHRLRMPKCKGWFPEWDDLSFIHALMVSMK